MTKMIKLSLAAAVAVSALTTSAAAGSLEDAVKDTTISGKAMIGYNYKKVRTVSTNQTEYDFDVTLTTKVNDTISFTSGIQADHEVAINSAQTTDANSKPNGQKITLTKLYFTAKTDYATVMIGKQKQPTPFLDDERGDGVVALIPAGPVTVAAGHFTGMNGGLNGEDISALAVIGTAGPVNASLWYTKMANTIDGYSLNVNGTAGPVKVDFTHSSSKLIDAANTEAQTLTKLIVTSKVADINLLAGYGMTNDTTLNGFGVDWEGVDAKTNFGIDQLSLDGLDDASAILVGASMTFGKTTAGIKYLTVDVATGSNKNEVDLDVAYAMSKNFSVTGLYSDTNNDGGDDTRMELSLNYKF